MIAVIVGTNRKKSKTALVARHYIEVLRQKTAEDIVEVRLEDVANQFIHDGMYNNDGMSEEMMQLQDDVLIPASHWVIVSPEYNGGLPGVLKTFIDVLSTRKYAETFHKRKIGLIGTSSGRAGNLRGMEMLTALFNYLGAWIMPNKLPVSNIETLIKDDVISDGTTLEALGTHAEQILDMQW